jgi:hypothetical protein
MLNPRITSSMMAAKRMASAGILRSRTRVVSNKDAIVKLITSPIIMPLILDILPSIPLAKIIGKRGSTQGEKTVSTPETKAIGSSKYIVPFQSLSLAAYPQESSTSIFMEDWLMSDFI